MHYRVRSADGELNYPTLLHVEQAYLAGLISPDDELIQEGQTEWRKIRSVPELHTRRKADGSVGGAFMPYVVGGVLLAVAAFVLLVQGRWMIALPLALILCAVLSRMTYKTYRARR
jgi:hypothetical protein